MNVIRAGYDQLVRAPTKTITFTGASGLGLKDVAVPVWTLTGRIFVVYMTAFCTVNIGPAIAGATIALGTASNTTALVGTTTSDDIDANEWWHGATPALGLMDNIIDHSYSAPLGLSESIIITPATQTTNAGTILLDAWYYPITAGASLT